jgi:hypothetical protein
MNAWTLVRFQKKKKEKRKKENRKIRKNREAHLHKNGCLEQNKTSLETDNFI